MSDMAGKDEYGGGRLKLFLSGAGAILVAFAAITTKVADLSDSIFSLSDTGHALLATVVFSFFIVYVMHDMLRFRDEKKVFLAGLAVIVIAAYWWIGFMAKHDIPPEPILAARLYPPNWAYLLMAVCLAAWAYWDIMDALKDEFDDKGFVFTAGGMLIIAIGISLFMTLRIPATM